MNILITDYYCASNRGDAAILEGELTALRKQFPKATFTVMTEYPDSARLINGVDAVKQRLLPFEPDRLKRNAASGYLLAGAPLLRNAIVPPKSRTIIERLELEPYFDADLIISTGGTHLTDIYFPGKVGILWELALAKRLGKPAVLYAQTTGPFEREPYRRLARRVLDRIDLITTRDAQSKEELRALGVEESPIDVTADAAFTMPSSPPEPKLIQRNTNTEDVTLDADELNVSISVRKWSYFESTAGARTYRNAVATTADWLVSECDAHVTFLSTCTGFAGYHTDDRVTAHDIVNRMTEGETERVEISHGEYTPYELRDIYGRMDLHIGTRMHSNILAMSAETPVVAIQYQFKTAGLMDQFGLTDWMIDIEAVTADSLIALTNEALDSGEAIGERIHEKLPKMRARSERSAKLIAELDGVA